MKMDPRQSQAVTAGGSDILVSASAGAGKTRVLVERLVSLCAEKHIGMNEILAVTFTEAAASEMKNRVAARLQELSAAADDTEKAWLSSQLVLLADADITTIDSFCLNIIRKYFSVIGLDPATAENILDDSLKKTMLEDAFTAALAEYDRKDHSRLLALFEAYSPRSEDYDAVKTMVLSLKDLADRSGDAENYLRSSAELFRNVRKMSDLPDVIRKSFFARIRLSWDTTDQYFQELIRLADSAPDLLKNRSQLDEAYNLFRSTEQALKDENYDHFRELFEAFGTAQKTPSSSKIPGYNGTREELYKKGLEKITEVLYSSDILFQDMRELAPYTETLAELTVLTMRNFQKIKAENACMDFTDMEQYAWEILNRNDGEVANLFRARLKEVMVDEFQDTSYLQNEIIRTVARPGTIFRVGDVKQSIYRFRGAKPALMRGLAEEPAMCRITLDHNYRSSSKIIEFSNILFDRLMNIDGGEDTYGSEDIVTPGSEDQKKPDDPPVRMILLEDPEAAEEPSEEGGEAGSGEESYTAKERKAGWIASKMIELHETGCRWNEFCVLVRSHAEKITLARIFEHCGIPYDIDTRQGFYNSDLCRYILALLCCLADPSDDLSLLSVLSGELFEMSDEALAQLRLNYGSLRKGVEAAHPEIISWFRELREHLNEGMPALLDRIALYQGFYEKLTDAGKANFDFLYEKTIRASQKRFTIHDLIRMMTAGADEKSSNATCRSKDDDVVTVTTIHQSKGLQYKVVFLWSSGDNRLMDSRNALISDIDIPFSLKHYDMPWRTSRNSIARIAAEHRQNVADIAEYIRVLYVALTRAESVMYIVDLAKCEQPYRQVMTLSELNRRKGITGYITAAMNPIPGLYTVEHVPAEAFRTVPETLPSYVKSLPHYTLPSQPVLPVMRPSDTEFTSLPPLNPGAASRGTRYGTLIHEVIAALPDRMWTKEDFNHSVLRESDIEAILHFAHSPIYQKALGMEIKKELPFYAEDPVTGQPVTGVMDFAAFGEDEILLVDFKTDAVSPETIRSRYSGQLNIYRSVLHLLKPGIPVHAWAWSFHNRMPVEIPEN